MVTHWCAERHYAFAHELGHVYDANHYNDTSGSDNHRAYWDPEAGFQTLMASQLDRSLRILHFSNPWVPADGLATDTPLLDNVTRMDELVASVAEIGADHPATPSG